MTETEIAFLSTTELSNMIATTKISPVEVVTAYLNRAQELDGKLNSYITICAEEALKAAREAEQAIMRGDYLGPMHGIPVAIKDQILTKGIRTTSGSTILEGFIPQEDATVVSKLKEGGAILLGKTNLHEFALGLTFDFPFGTPKNPWDLSRTAGGSSGGSASATAASLCATSLGEDTGGSIRWPSSLCGIVGLRPSWGRVSRHGLLGACWSMDAIGPMSRTVADCAMTLELISGYDPKDSYTWNTPVPNYSHTLGDSIKGMRIGVLSDQLYSELVTPDVQKAVVEAIDVMRGLGAVVQDVSLPQLDRSRVISRLIGIVEAATVHHQYVRERLQEYEYQSRIALLTGSLVPAQAYYKAQQLRALWRHQVLQVLDTVDVLVLPTSPTAAPPLPTKPNVGSKEEVKAELLGRWGFVNLVSLASSPGLTVPCGFTPSGLPIGLQIVGRPFDEKTVLNVGYAYEQATDWHTQRPPI